MREVATSERGRRESFEGATGASDMAGGLGSRPGGVLSGRAMREAAEIQSSRPTTSHLCTKRVRNPSLIDNRILQVQTVILSRRRRLPAHGLHCFKALTIQRFTWRERDHPPTRFLRIQETLNADQRVCPAGSSLSRFRPMRRMRHARLGITDWTISTVPPG